MYQFIKTHSNNFARTFKNQFRKNDGFTLIEMIVVKKTLNAL
ncbi:prepilin-type N-terminal cleavage/methylation domain-containing protein [Macrococcoides bohemicum]|nr:prepilin-type N-terminal cleavage/methylation domain-containing protein [Macrococcus bohemicus]TDL40603.1 prepilin-type N-terminal cleavage/methylation domain-containing protein [Macrococcus bohemicus]